MAASVCKSSATNKFVGDCKVLDVEVEDGKVVAVLTSRGRVATEQVLVSTGIWGPLLTRLAGFEVPLSPVEHQYAETAPLGAFKGAADAASVPMVRDQDCRMYFKQHWEGLGIGSYDHDPLLVEPSRYSMKPFHTRNTAFLYAPCPDFNYPGPHCQIITLH